MAYRTRAVVAIAIGSLVVASACSPELRSGGSAVGATTSTMASAPTNDPTGVAAEATTDELTPLLVTPLNQPIPVKGADGRYHVAYELQLENASTRSAHLTDVETLTTDGRALHSITGDELVSRTQLVGEMPDPPKPATEIPAGQVATLILDDPYATAADVPATFTHEITADFGPVPPGQHPFASQFPSHIVARTGPVTLGQGQPLRIGPPLRGADWLAANACCQLTAHRGAMLPLNGRMNATERYAIDFLRIDPAQLKDPSKNTSGGLPSFTGDPSAQASYLAYGQDLLAVGDATVVDVVDGRPDAVPHVLPSGLSLQELGGNYVLLDLGDGYYAFYGHVVAGSFTVKKGDHVAKGAVIGKLGNSGNSSEAHLHFHIARGPTPLAADNWPYEFDSFTAQGTVDERDGSLDTATIAPGPRTDALPLTLNVIDFPG
jgi:hypothetical protein